MVPSRRCRRCPYSARMARDLARLREDRDQIYAALAADPAHTMSSMMAMIKGRVFNAERARAARDATVAAWHPDPDGATETARVVEAGRRTYATSGPPGHLVATVPCRPTGPPARWARAAA